jgi:triacylglycerol esterase/lipase EstA (alpha/beta hydrolase family)
MHPMERLSRARTATAPPTTHDPRRPASHPGRGRRRAIGRCAVAAALAIAALCVSAPTNASAATPGRVNDFACRPTATHPNPVVLLHGLGATWYEDINFLQLDLAAKGCCTFALTYGAYDGFPLVGGLKPVATSAAQIKAYVQSVLSATGAAKVDLVGHSEGGFQTLYVTKTQGIANRIGRVVAIAPPTHGTTFAGLYNLAPLLGIESEVHAALSAVGCGACSDLTNGGAAVAKLTTGPIAQPGVKYTIITSRYDELVTPTSTSFVNEPGVTNQYVQSSCPFDPVGHIGEAYDLNVWHLVSNALDPAHATPIWLCAVGSPG